MSTRFARSYTLPGPFALIAHIEGTAGLGASSLCLFLFSRLFSSPCAWRLCVPRHFVGAVVADWAADIVLSLEFSEIWAIRLHSD